MNWEIFPDKVAVQMNDTHPTLCIPELIRILMDVKGLSWKEAWNITRRYFTVSMLTIVCYLQILSGCLIVGTDSSLKIMLL